MYFVTDIIQNIIRYLKNLINFDILSTTQEYTNKDTIQIYPYAFHLLNYVLA